MVGQAGIDWPTVWILSEGSEILVVINQWVTNTDKELPKALELISQ